jgi:hypothetical protein
MQFSLAQMNSISSQPMIKHAFSLLNSGSGVGKPKKIWVWEWMKRKMNTLI